MRAGFVVGVALACGSVAAALEVDFGTEIGKIRPELHSSGFGPTICSQTAQDLADVKEMGFSLARTHDWALINANERVCDWHHIFPLPHLDAKDPANYVFGPTDYLLKRTREDAGLDIFFRLGTSIEHSGRKVHFNALVPKDFDQVAEVFAGTVRHYNRRWANGHEWNIRYWEIWNEPDGVDNMWCLPEGDEPWDVVTSEDRAKRERRWGLFAKFFVKCLKRLKDEFGDSIEVGGPALCGFDASPGHDQVDFARRLLLACKAAGTAPDFLSWHHYTSDPMCLANSAERARRLCDELGFPDCKLVVNEWHYFGTNYSWADMQRCSDPKVKARIWNGPDSHNGIRASVFTLATLANLQRSKLDQAYFYGCRHTGSWGFKDDFQAKYKIFYALKLFGQIVKGYTTICPCTSEGPYTMLAVKAADGMRKGLLVADYCGKDPLIDVSVNGVKKMESALLLDATHDLAPHRVTLRDGRLVLEKRDGHPAAFFIEFR